MQIRSLSALLVANSRALNRAATQHGRRNVNCDLCLLDTCQPRVDTCDHLAPQLGTLDAALGARIGF